MSVYPVRLSKWYGPRSFERSVAKSILSVSWCAMCGKMPPLKTAIADHSLAWGYYRNIFCDRRCEREYDLLCASLENK